MRLTKNAIYVGLLTATLASVSAFFSSWQVTNIALIFSILASILLVVLGRKLAGCYSNFTVVFLIFSAFYGLSGPIAACYGKGLPEVFPTPYLTHIFILHYSLAIVAMSMGLLVSAGVKVSNVVSALKNPIWNINALLIQAYLFAVIGSLAEIINLIRVGGTEVLFAGKAAYQSAVSDLSGTLPSFEFMLLATSLLGLSISGSIDKTYKMRCFRFLALWLILVLPLILILLILGKRGELLSLLVVFIISYSFFKPIKKIKFKWVVAAFILYLIMGFLYGTRAYIGYAITTGDWNVLTKRLSRLDFWVSSLNPASNEFGAPFGNFNTYILFGDDELRYGDTYLKGLTIPIPGFIWPDKPQSITYEFRDTFFSDWSQRGSIAGTAFSSILEAYINFGTFGVSAVYFLLAIAMGFLEKMRNRTTSLVYALFYLTLIPEAITFHRSSFGMPLFWPIILSIIGSFSYIAFKSIIYKQFSLKKEVYIS